MVTFYLLNFSERFIGKGFTQDVFAFSRTLYLHKKSSTISNVPEKLAFQAIGNGAFSITLYFKIFSIYLIMIILLLSIPSALLLPLLPPEQKKILLH